jgi:hypothetical protein
MRTNPGKAAQIVCANGSVAKHAISATRETASAALACAGVIIAAESSTGDSCCCAAADITEELNRGSNDALRNPVFAIQAFAEGYLSLRSEFRFGFLSSHALYRRSRIVEVHNRDHAEDHLSGLTAEWIQHYAADRGLLVWSSS